MYTIGITKIFTCQAMGTKFVFIKSMAEAAGYNALSFQSVIYVKPEDEDWEETVFRLEDFKCY